MKRLVELMHGELDIQSSLGKGTTVTVRLPVKVPAAPEPSVPLDGFERVTGRPLRILLVEDEKVNQLVIRRMLEKEGHTVETANDGRAALDFLTRSSCDCVLMDVRMPGLDGIAATAAIRTWPAFSGVSGLPIIALTAYAMAGDKEKFLAAGMDDYISKPVQKARLCEVLDRVVGAAMRRNGVRP